MSDEMNLDPLEQLMKKQGRKCGGCQNPLTGIYRSGGVVGGDYGGKFEGLGFVNLRIPKRLKGKDVPSNSWLLCAHCLGSTTVNSQMPTWLYNKAKAYRDENPEDFRSMTHLMRTALEQYILSEDEHKEKAKIADVAKEFEMKLSKWMESMPEELARYSSPTVDYEMDGMLFEVKSKRIDDKRQGEDSGPSDVV